MVMFNLVSEAQELTGHLEGQACQTEVAVGVATVTNDGSCVVVTTSHWAVAAFAFTMYWL